MEGRPNTQGMRGTEMGATTMHTPTCAHIRLPFHSLHIIHVCISVVSYNAKYAMNEREDRCVWVCVCMF